MSEKTAIQTIKILKQFQIIETRAPSGLFLGSEQTPPTNDTNDTNERTIQAEASSARLDFDSLYKEYPRREKKTPSLKKLRRLIKTPEEYSSLSQAIRNYKTIKGGGDPKYLMQMTTFLDEWRDWLDPNHGKTQEKKPELSYFAQQILEEQTQKGMK